MAKSLVLIFDPDLPPTFKNESARLLFYDSTLLRQ